MGKLDDTKIFMDSFYLVLNYNVFLERTATMKDFTIKASYYKDICNNEISIAYLQEAKKTLDEYLKKVEEN